jgi:predicted GNAT family acetyltransferase
MAHEVRRADTRFELLVDGEVAALADAVDDGAVTTIPHVETEPGFRRQGLATELVAAVFELLRAQGRQVRPQCPFAAAFAAAHPEYADLVVR